MSSTEDGLNGDLVSCNDCGVVFEKEKVPSAQCPVCEATGPRTPVLKVGRVNKWWSKI